MGTISFNYEPAIWLALINAGVILLIAFGIPITNEQKIAIGAFAEALLAVISGLIVRSQVTPTAKLK